MWRPSDETATRDHRPVFRDHRCADDTEAYATDVPRDVMWRPSDGTPFQIQRSRAIKSRSHASGRASLARERLSDGRLSSNCTDRTFIYLGQTVSIDMGLRIGNGSGLNAAEDMEDVPHRSNVYVTDVPRDDSVAPEQRNRDPRPSTRDRRPATIVPRSVTIDPRSATIDLRPSTR